MRLIFTLFVFLACAGSALAQVEISLASVRKDFREASVVVRMNITDTKVIPGTSDNYAYEYIASGEVTMSFKGKFKVGQRVEYRSRAEEGINHADMRGDRIAFLTSSVDRRNGPFKELPDGNSVHPYFPDLLLKVKTVARQSPLSRRISHH